MLRGSEGSTGSPTADRPELKLYQPPGNRHIHFHAVTADGYEGTGFVMLFDDNVRNDVRSWAESTGFGVVVELTGDAATGDHGSVEIDLEPS